LGCLEVKLSTANQLVKLAFEPVFNLGVPSRAMGFRPEILDRIGATEFEWNQAINLVIASAMRCECRIPGKLGASFPPVHRALFWRIHGCKYLEL
jgi:hypothetical protein